MYKRTGKLPTGLKDKPAYSPYVNWYIRTFYSLCASRQIGMAAGSIPVSEITNYYNNYEIPDDRETFLTVVQAMDGVYLEHNKPKK